MKKPDNYYGYAFDKEMKNDKRKKRWNKQRREFGVDDSETWSLDVTLAHYILPRLKMYNKVAFNVIDAPELQKDVEKMIEAFEIIVSDDNYVPTKEQNEKVQEGLDLFAKNYRALWW